MKRIALLLLTVIAFAAQPARAEVEISFDFFHTSLSPYGEWCEVDGYGHVWHPTGMDPDWAPYTDGYWSYTDAGWTWVSYEDFGGITYHYGRWLMLDRVGWCWVPDYEWGPAWVSWRRDDDYVGWAPLPPEARWERRSGIGVWADVSFDIGPGYFRFVRWQNFGAPVIRHVCEPPARNVVIIERTINITNISYRDDYDCVFNGGFDYDYVNTRVARPVPALKLVRNKTTNIFINGNKGNVFINSPQGNALVVAAPPVATTNYNVLTKKLDVQRKFSNEKVTRGWAGLDKDGTRDRLLVKMREETRGKTKDTAPAKAPKLEALTAVPKKVDFEAKNPALLVAPRKRGEGGEGRNKDGVAVAQPAENAGDKQRVEPAVAGRDGGMRRDGSGRDRGEAGLETPGSPGAAKPAADFGKRNKGEPENGKNKGGSVAGTPGENRGEGRGNGENAARREMEKQQIAAELAEKEQRKEVEKAADRAAKVQQEEARKQKLADAEAAKAAEKAAARAAEMQKEEARRQKTTEAAAAKDAEKAAARAAEMQKDQARRQKVAEAEAALAADKERRKAAEAAERQRAMEREQQKAEEKAVEKNFERQRMAEAEQRKAAEKNAERQRAAEAEQRRAAEKAERQRAMENEQRRANDSARQRAEADARARAMEGERRRAEESARRRDFENQQRAAEQSRARAEMQRQQANEAARQRASEQARADQARAAQAEAFRRSQPQQFNSGGVPQGGNGSGKGKGKGKNKDD